MPQLILIVDDEPDLSGTIAYALERYGFATRVAGSGAAAFEALAAEIRPDLVILDVMLPDVSGFEICRRIRANPRGARMPVLMLTARGEELDRVVGFEVGADDYVVKPFSVRELALRVRALLRRAEPAGELTAAGGVVTFGRLEFDDDAHRVLVDGVEVLLTALEHRLLRVLLERRGRVQSRETLLNEVWGRATHVGERTVDTHVKRLREKLGPAGDYVETLRGVGYRFKTRPEEQKP